MASIPFCGSTGMHVLLVTVFSHSLTCAFHTVTSAVNIQKTEASFTSALDESATYGSKGYSLQSSSGSKESTVYVPQFSMLERTAISEEERTIDGSQDSILETSGDLEEGTSPSSMAQSQPVSEDEAGSQTSIPQSSPVPEESTTNGSPISIQRTIPIFEEGRTPGSKDSTSSMLKSSSALGESTVNGPPSPTRPLPFLKEDSTSWSAGLSLVVAVGGAVIVIITCSIFVIAMTLRNRKRSGKCTSEEVGPSQLGNSLQHSTNEESDQRPSNASVSELLANVPVNSSEEIRGVDVAIPCSTYKQSPEDVVINQQPVIACASLERKTEPINLEHDEISGHTTAQTNIGTLGDINATPDANSVADTSSAANVSDGSYIHVSSVEVTKQEDADAIPIKISESPNADNSGEVVCKNMETEILGTEH